MFVVHSEATASFSLETSPHVAQISKRVNDATSLNAHSDAFNALITLALSFSERCIMFTALLCVVAIALFCHLRVSCFLPNASLWEQSVRGYSGTQVPACYVLSYEMQPNTTDINHTITSWKLET